ncbi:hypothetical protein Tco_1361184 [Tanacetum coccineum]
MAISSSSSSSSSDNKVQNCSKQCLESFKTLQKNFDSEREKHNRAKLEIQGYELVLRKGAVLDAEAEAFLADVECTAPYDQPQALTTTNMFQANHEDAYDSDVDEGPNAAVAFMANLKRKINWQFLQSEKEKILSEKKDLADSYLDEIVCLKNANKVARDMLQRFNMPTHTIPMLSKKPKAATADLHKDLLGTRNPGLGYIAKRAQPVLYDADTLLHPAHHPVRIWDSEDVLVHQVVSMKKMSEKPGHVRPANGFYDKLNAMMFVPQKELSQEQAYWLSATMKMFHEVVVTTSLRHCEFSARYDYSLRIQLDRLRTSNRPTQKPPVQQNKKPNVPVNLSTRTKPATESRKPMPKSHTRNHRILPSKSVNARRAADHNRKLNVVDHNQFVIRSLKSVNTKTPQAKHSVNHTKKVWKATRNHNVNTTKTAWRPTGKVVGSVKPQWKPTGRHFALYDNCPLTRIMEPIVEPLELTPSVSSSSKVTMISRFTDCKLSDRKAGSKGISEGKDTSSKLSRLPAAWHVRLKDQRMAKYKVKEDHKLIRIEFQSTTSDVPYQQRAKEIYNGLTLRHRDTINAAAGGTFIKRGHEECYDLIKNMTAHHNDWDTSAQRSKSSSSITSSNQEIAALKLEMAEINKNLMKMLQTNQQVNSVTPSCETCGGPHSYINCPATVGQTQKVDAA